METNPEQQFHVAEHEQPAEAGLGLATRIADTLRNGYESARRRTTTYVAIGASTLSLAGGATARTMIFNPESVAAENVPAHTSDTVSDLEQGCEDVALAKPQIIRPIYMNQAGIRPFTGSRYSQHMVGAVQYPDMSYCSPDYTRTSAGKLQLLKGGHWVRIWNQAVTGVWGNEGVISNVFAAPGHADPGYGYLFNDCTPNGDFHKVRILLRNKFKDSHTKQVIDEQDYILTAGLRGNCLSAAHSKQIAEKQQKQNYGT